MKSPVKQLMAMAVCVHRGATARRPGASRSPRRSAPLIDPNLNRLAIGDSDQGIDETRYQGMAMSSLVMAQWDSSGLYILYIYIYEGNTTYNWYFEP